MVDKILVSALRHAYGTRRCDNDTVFRPDIGPKLNFEDNVRCGRDGMVDIPDLKSVGRKPVGVRVPPPAPIIYKMLNLSVSCVLGWVLFSKFRLAL